MVHNPEQIPIASLFRQLQQQEATSSTENKKESLNWNKMSKRFSK
jgi:hypothetical protein